MSLTLDIIIAVHAYLVLLMFWYGFLLARHALFEDDGCNPYLAGFLHDSSSYFCSGVVLLVIGCCFFFEAVIYQESFFARYAMSIFAFLTFCFAVICFAGWRTVSSLLDSVS